MFHHVDPFVKTFLIKSYILPASLRCLHLVSGCKTNESAWNWSQQNFAEDTTDILILVLQIALHHKECFMMQRNLLKKATEKLRENFYGSHVSTPRKYHLQAFEKGEYNYT